MRTIQTTVYKFNELSEEGKQKVIAHIRKTIDTWYIYNEARETVIKFNDNFGTEEGRNSWLDVCTGHIDDCILELTGVRLRTYLLNNFFKALYTRRYFTLLDGNRKHRMCVNHTRRDGTGFSQVYSNIRYNLGGCPLTGVCYDDDILSPFYEFINKPDTRTFQDLIEEGFTNLKQSIESECEYQYTDEAIIETIEANDYEFTEDGELI